MRPLLLSGFVGCCAALIAMPAGAAQYMLSPIDTPTSAYQQGRGASPYILTDGGALFYSVDAGTALEVRNGASYLLGGSGQVTAATTSGLYVRGQTVMTAPAGNTAANPYGGGSASLLNDNLDQGVASGPPQYYTLTSRGFHVDYALPAGVNGTLTAITDNGRAAGEKGYGAGVVSDTTAFTSSFQPGSPTAGTNAPTSFGADLTYYTHAEGGVGVAGITRAAEIAGTFNVASVPRPGTGITPRLITHAFVGVNGVLTDIGALGSGGDYATNGVSSAADINDLGQVVGTSTFGGNLFGGYISGEALTHGFLYENGVMTDLNALIDPTLGYTIADAFQINNNGQILVDYTGADFPNRARLALLTLAPRAAAVPEPATWATTVAGFGIAGGSLRRRKAARKAAA